MCGKSGRNVSLPWCRCVHVTPWLHENIHSHISTSGNSVNETSIFILTNIMTLVCSNTVEVRGSHVWYSRSHIERSGFNPWLGTLCSWVRHLTLTVPLSTQVYKWILVICWGNLRNCRRVTCDRLASRLGGVEIILACSCCRNRDKLWQL